MKIFSAKSASNAFQKFTNLDTVTELYDAVVADTAIYFHVWDTFYLVLIYCSVCLHVSITHHTLVLMSLIDEEIWAVEPSGHVVALAMLSWPD
jgi:hypothetical protein